MKKLFAVAALFAVLSAPAHAEGDLVCTITVSAGVTDTQQMTDGGLVCPWVAGAAVPMQCPNAKVCYNPGSLDRLSDGGLQQLLVRNLEADGGLGPTDGGTLADAGAVSTTSNRGPRASSGDLCVNFLDSSGNSDPYLIFLGTGQRNISLTAVEIGDAGATVNCKFANSKRRIQ